MSINRAATALKELWNDDNFQDELLKFLVFDREFLGRAAHYLTQEDFGKIEEQQGNERNVIAQVALNFYNHYKEPVGKLIRTEALDFARSMKWDRGSTSAVLANYIDTTVMPGQHKRIAADAIFLKVQKYKTEHYIAQAVQKTMDLQGQGKMTPDQFLLIAREAIDKTAMRELVPVDLFADQELENRISRRFLQLKRERYPVLMIDPIDRMVRICARKHMGLVLAPYKRGKTLFFIWLALAYTLQGLNVLFFTLEDPLEDIEDRFDAAIGALPLSTLAETSDSLRIKFARWKKLLRSRLKIVDGTDGKTTVGAIENTWEAERNRGFAADAVLVDYDDEIRPQKKQLERRMEFADIYRDFRAFLARKSAIGWTASQTSRASAELKIISGKYIAEDISKIRKCAMALSLGKGEWGPDSIFLWVAAHRYDRQEVGAHIISNKSKGLFYDRDLTLAREKEEARKKKKP